MHDVEQFLVDVSEELGRAEAANPPMNSYHEAYAVILEEVDEFWEIVRAKPHLRIKEEARAELIQIAAMCQRAAQDLKL